MDSRTDTSPREALLASLERSSLLPSAAQYRDCWRDVYERGADLRRQMSARVGQRAWDAAIPAPGTVRLRFDTVRILGFGHGLTDYICATLPLDDADRARVNELGALTNLIVCLYDYALDRSDEPVSTLNEQTLKAMISRRFDPRLVLAQYFGPPELKLMARLVRHWFKDVAELARRRDRNDLLAMIHRAVIGMYQSEHATRDAPAETCRHMLRRKNALPFLVMGLPAWLAVDDVDAAALRAHLRWTYRLGLFIGAIDDAIDLPADLEAGQPNQYTLENPPSAAAVAARGATIGASWRARARADCRDDPLVANMLTAVIASWFGGLTARVEPFKSVD